MYSRDFPYSSTMTSHNILNDCHRILGCEDSNTYRKEWEDYAKMFADQILSDYQEVMRLEHENQELVSQKINKRSN